MLERIISGGQSGVDQAALDAAIVQGLPHGGMCPAGRRYEFGVIPAHYQLEESDWSSYQHRTRQNIINSDGTLILSGTEKLTGGTLLTRQMALKEGKVSRVVVLDGFEDPPYQAICEWLACHDIKTLNVAGPRESKAPRLYDRAVAFLIDLLFLV